MSVEKRRINLNGIMLFYFGEYRGSEHDFLLEYQRAKIVDTRNKAYK